MISISDQLKQCRFIHLHPSDDEQKGKSPLESEWTTKKNYDYKCMASKNLVKYGVLCGHDGLMVVDCDLQDFQDACLKRPEFNTFTVKSARKGMCHFYFKTDKPTPETKRFDKVEYDDSGKKEIDNELHRTRACDIQGSGAQVLGPNSIIAGKSYTVVNAEPIKTISYDALIDFCMTAIPGLEKASNKKKKKKSVQEQVDMTIDDFEHDPVIKYIKSKYTVRDVLAKVGIDVSKSANCECPFHSSESGQCLSYEDHQWNCFHCNRGGSMFDLVMMINKCSFPEARERLAAEVGVPDKIIKEAKRLALKQKKADATEFLVEKVMKDNYIYSIKRDDKPEMWIYDNGVYLPNGKSEIRQICRVLTGEHYTINLANQVIAKINEDTCIDEEDFFESYYPGKIPVENGVLDVISREFTSFDPDMIFFSKFPVVYDPEINDCPNIMKFIHSTLKSEEDIQTLQEFIGYLLYNKNKFKKAFLLIGDGDNGKSVMIDLIQELMSKVNVSNVSLQTLDDDKYSASELFGKVANINADIGKGRLEETGMLKNLIAGDKISACRKFLSPINFRFLGKMLFAANKLPETEDETDGFFTRWIILEFPYTFKRQDEYDLLSKTDKSSGRFKLADSEILENMTTEKEMSGFLNWALIGLDRLLKNKEFTKSSSVDKIKKFWERKSSTMKSFVMDKLEFRHTNPETYMFVSDLKNEYIKYCNENNLKPQSPSECNRCMNFYPAEYKSKRFLIEGAYDFKKIWSGVTMKIRGDEE